MISDVHSYIVAPKKNRRASLPSDWRKRVQNFPGVLYVRSRAGMMEIRAPEGVRRRLAGRIGRYCEITEGTLAPGQSVSGPTAAPPA